MVMSELLDIVTVVFLALGCFFGLTGAVGILRMPDFFTRIHPAGKSDTLAQFLIMIGLLFQAQDPLSCARLVMITGFIFLTSPVAVHAITQAAHLAGLKPWRKEAPHE